MYLLHLWSKRQVETHSDHDSSWHEWDVWEEMCKWVSLPTHFEVSVFPMSSDNCEHIASGYLLTVVQKEKRNNHQLEAWYLQLAHAISTVIHAHSCMHIAQRYCWLLAQMVQPIVSWGTRNIRRTGSPPLITNRESSRTASGKLC